jgi:DNA helicase HerA-like ATPase
MTSIKISHNTALPLRLANRHGLVTGSTGSGKTTTAASLIEQFSAAGVPVFASDVKGDLAGLSRSAPVRFLDLFSKHGEPVRTSVQEVGALLVGSILSLNDSQSGALQIAYKQAEDDRDYMLTLDDLRWRLNDMIENREDVCRRYGNVTAASIAAIQRQILALEAQGADRMFGEPRFDINELMATSDGKGLVTLLHADQLLEAPKLYATFLLWLLTELFRVMPEAGDLAKPKLVFFFDEAHLLFRDAPKALLHAIERLVRLVRSKGVGVYFVTQSPTDVPTAVLEQLGTRIMHSMRAHTAESLRKIRAAADTIRPNPDIDVKTELPSLAIGEALVSVIGDQGIPTPAAKVMIRQPTSPLCPVAIEDRHTVPEATLDPQAAHHQFQRRMLVERGLNPGPEELPPAYEPGLWQRFVPDFASQPRRGFFARLFA